MPSQTHYEVLGITPDDLSGKPQEEIERIIIKNFRKRARVIHPDSAEANRPKSTMDAGVAMAALTEARDTLIDPGKRFRYDDLLERTHQTPPATTSPKPKAEHTSSSRPSYTTSSRPSYTTGPAPSLFEHILRNVKTSFKKPYAFPEGTDIQQVIRETISRSREGLGIYEQTVNDYLLTQFQLDQASLTLMCTPGDRSIVPDISFYDLMQQKNIGSSHILQIIKAKMSIANRDKLYQILLRRACFERDKEIVNPLINENVFDAMIEHIELEPGSLQLVKTLISSRHFLPQHLESLIEKTNSSFSLRTLLDEAQNATNIVFTDAVANAALEKISGRSSDVKVVKILSEMHPLTNKQRESLRMRFEGTSFLEKIQGLLASEPEVGFVRRLFSR